MNKIKRRIVLTISCLAVSATLFFVGQQKLKSAIMISDNVEAVSDNSGDVIMLENGAMYFPSSGVVLFPNQVNNKNDDGDVEPGCTTGSGTCEISTNQPEAEKSKWLTWINACVPYILSIMAFFK